MTELQWPCFNHVSTIVSFQDLVMCHGPHNLLICQQKIFFFGGSEEDVYYQDKSHILDELKEASTGSPTKQRPPNIFNIVFTYYGHYMPGYCFPFLKIKYHCLIVVFMKIKMLYGQIQCTTFILKTLGFPSLTGYKSLPDYDVGSTPCRRCPYRVQEGST